MSNELQKLRAELDKIDSELVALLSERFKVTQKVGALKARDNLPPADPSREKEIMMRLEKLANEQNVPPELVKNIMRLIITEVKSQHAEFKS